MGKIVNTKFFLWEIAKLVQNCKNRVNRCFFVVALGDIRSLAKDL